MWKQLLSVFTDCGLCQEAFDEALLMLKTSHGMHRDSVAALRGEGILVADIYERDVQTTLKRLLTLAEPIIIIGIALLITVIILSVVLMILESNNLAF